MVLNYQNRAFALSNGIAPENECGETHFDSDKVCRDLTFCHFGHLCMEDTLFINCTFEDCLSVATDTCRLVGCTFRGVQNIESCATDFIACTFSDCTSEGPFLTLDSRSQVDGCRFETITSLEEDGCVIHALHGGRQDPPLITRCSFTGCRVENEEGEECCYTCIRPFSVVPCGEAAI